MTAPAKPATARPPPEQAQDQSRYAWVFGKTALAVSLDQLLNFNPHFGGGAEEPSFVGSTTKNFKEFAI